MFEGESHTGAGLEPSGEVLRFQSPDSCCYRDSHRVVLSLLALLSELLPIRRRRVRMPVRDAKICSLSSTRQDAASPNGAEIQNAVETTRSRSTSRVSRVQTLT